MGRSALHNASTCILAVSLFSIATSTTAAEFDVALPVPAETSEFPVDDPLLVALGQKLFFDPILSGNKNIACATCHHPSLGTSDGMSLGLGEGGIGLGAMRRIGSENQNVQRIPRNAPALWNKGSSQFSMLFHDGRVSIDPKAPFGVRMPEGRALEREVNSLLAAQALLPILSADEMAGHPGENEIADAVAEGRIHGPNGAWQRLADRIAEIEEYQSAFTWLNGADQALHIAAIGNAIGAFIAFEFRSTDSPFDAYLLGEQTALTAQQFRGMELFYGDAGCSSCHAGTYQTNQSFQSVAMPQLGPGKGDASAEYSDLGRYLVTGDPEDRYKFLVPSLRNITLTEPYGHAGAFTTLDAVIDHHMQPVDSLVDYDLSEARLHDVAAWVQRDRAAMDDLKEIVRIGASATVQIPLLNEAQKSDVLAFLEALEDPIATKGRLGVPSSVPSGLALDRLDDRQITRATDSGPSEASRARVSASAANMRSGPGLQYPRIAVLMEGYRVTVLGALDSEWTRVSTHDGLIGFVARSLIQ